MAQKNPQWLIGIHPVASALASGKLALSRLLLANEAHNPRVLELETQAQQQGIRVERCARRELDRLSQGERHQDVLAEFAAANEFVEADLPALLDALTGEPLVLVLDGVQDPHNLGACLRTAEAAGVQLVIIPKDKSATLTPVARRAASGAAETLDIVSVTNLARVLRLLKDRGIWLAGAEDEASQQIYQSDLTGPLALVMGGEGKGLRRLTGELCDYRIRIPMAGSVSSLNVSVATGVCLFEIIRQRNMKARAEGSIA
jgi:23S rRNA (guanosine2251-2'-O)-methyltransferase